MLAAPIDHAMTLRPVVLATSSEIRLADLIADTSGMDDNLRKTVILRLPDNRNSYRLTARAVIDLVRRRIPGIAVSASGADMVRFSRMPLTSARLPAQGCWESVRPIDAGATVRRGDVRPVPCIAGQTRARIRFDQVSQSNRLVDAVSAGAYLGRVLALDDDRIQPGTAMTLRSTSGPVVVERPVWTMQPGRNGRRVFVRDGDGAVHSVKLSLSHTGD